MKKKTLQLQTFDTKTLKMSILITNVVTKLKPNYKIRKLQNSPNFKFKRKLEEHLKNKKETNFHIIFSTFFKVSNLCWALRQAIRLIFGILLSQLKFLNVNVSESFLESDKLCISYLNQKLWNIRELNYKSLWFIKKCQI